jgi:hypothetical protein
VLIVMLLSIHFVLVLRLLIAFHLVSGLVNFNTNVYWRSNLRTSFAFPSLLHVATSTDIRDRGLDVKAAARATEADQFYVELEKAGLSLCHGALHASGCRRLADLRKLTTTQITTMGTDVFDLKCLHRVMADQNTIMHDQDNGNNDECAAVNLSTVVNGVFVNTKSLSRFEVAKPHDFDFQVISSEHDIFTGRLFTLEQCDVLNRMSEYHAYKGMGKVGAGWTNEICECIWGMLLVVFNLDKR